MFSFWKEHMDDLFDSLKYSVEYLNENPELDNEAMRHDHLIYPFLTSGLGWNKTDLISQSSINVPKNVANSHIFRNAVPLFRRPDIIISPYNLSENFVVIEEKKRQKNLENLNLHRLQLCEYQALYETTWGILTDGEKWLIKRNFTTYQSFKNLDELKSEFKEVRRIFSKGDMIERFRSSGNTDVANVIYLPELLIPSKIDRVAEKVLVAGIYDSIRFQNNFQHPFHNSPVNINDLLAVFENHLGTSIIFKKIKVGERFGEEKGSSGCIHEYHINPELNLCQERFYKLDHAIRFCVENGTFSDFYRKNIRTIHGLDSEPQISGLFESYSKVVATCMLIPCSKWYELDDWMLNHQATTFEMAHWFRIPKEICDFFLTDIYPTAKNIYQVFRHTSDALR